MVLTYRLENTFVLMITLYFLHFTNVDFYDLSLISVYNLKKLLHIFHHGRSLSHKITNCFKLSVLFDLLSLWMITENIIGQWDDCAGHVTDIQSVIGLNRNQNRENCWHQSPDQLQRSDAVEKFRQNRKSHEDLGNFDDDEEFTPRFSFWRPKSRAWTNG